MTEPVKCVSLSDLLCNVTNLVVFFQHSQTSNQEQNIHANEKAILWAKPKSRDLATWQSPKSRDLATFETVVGKLPNKMNRKNKIDSELCLSLIGKSDQQTLDLQFMPGDPAWQQHIQSVRDVWIKSLQHAIDKVLIFILFFGMHQLG